MLAGDLSMLHASIRVATCLPAARRVARRGLLALVWALLVGGISAYVQVSAGGPLSSVDEAVHDLIVSLRTPESYLGDSASGSVRDPREFITIVAIDERTFAELGAYN